MYKLSNTLNIIITSFKKVMVTKQTNLISLCPLLSIKFLPGTVWGSQADIGVSSAGSAGGHAGKWNSFAGATEDDWESLGWVTSELLWGGRLRAYVELVLVLCLSQSKGTGREPGSAHSRPNFSPLSVLHRWRAGYYTVPSTLSETALIFAIKARSKLAGRQTPGCFKSNRRW